MVQPDSLQRGTDRISRRSFLTTETHDADTHSRCITGWNCSYGHVGRQTFRGKVTELCLWPIQIFRDRLDQPCVWRGSAWSGAIIFSSFVTAGGKLLFDGRQVAANAVTVVPWNFTEQFFCSAPTDSLTIAVQEEALAVHAQKLLGREVSREALRRCHAIIRAEAVEEYLRCTTATLGELGTSPRLLDSDHYRQSIKDRVLDMLVRLLDPSLVESWQMPPPSTRSYVVAKATQYIEAHLADPLVMSDVCQATRVSPRTLRYSFEEIVGVTPSQYLLGLRLARARQGLQRAKAGSSVHCIAERCGFAHMGRFAQFYSAAFGEYPSDTLQTAGKKLVAS